MSRPIPEGVKPPEGAVILGWGGEFKVPRGQGVRWAWSASTQEWLDDDGLPWTGAYKKTLYAADAGSEVARLNQPTTNPPQISNSVVGAIESIRDLSTDGLSFALYSATVRVMCKEAIKLAKGTE